MSDMKSLVVNANRAIWRSLTEKKTHQTYYRKILIHDPETQIRMELQHYPVGFMTPLHQHGMGLGMYVLKGHLKTNFGIYHQGEFVWDPKNLVIQHGGTEDDDAYVFYFTTGPYSSKYVGNDVANKENNLQEKVIDSNKMLWEDRYNPRMDMKSYRKLFLNDPDSGVYFHLRHYPAKFRTPWHKHPMAHGMYVLKGLLKTNEGEYGPGNFVWSPEGLISEHGGADDQDVYLLFITNKKYDIEYLDDYQPDSTN